MPFGLALGAVMQGAQMAQQLKKQKETAAPDATTTGKKPSLLQTFGSQFAGGAGGSLGSGLGGGVGGGLGGAVGNKITDAINGTPGEQAKEYMDTAYPGTNVAERLGNNAAASVGGAAQTSRTAQQVAAINASATKYAADRQLEGEKIKQGMVGDSPKVARELAKLDMEIRKLTAEGTKSLTEADEARFKRQYWELYVNKDTALNVWQVPFSKATDDTLKTMARWLTEKTGMKDTYRWLKGEVDIMGRPKLSKNPTRVSRANTIGKKDARSSKIFSSYTRYGP